MIFLVNPIPKSTDSGPTPEFFKLVINEWEKVLELKKKGKIIDSFGYAEKMGAFSIWKVNSKEELLKNLEQLPLHSYMEWDISLLNTAEETLANYKQKFG